MGESKQPSHNAVLPSQMLLCVAMEALNHIADPCTSVQYLVEEDELVFTVV